MVEDFLGQRRSGTQEVLVHMSQDAPGGNAEDKLERNGGAKSAGSSTPLGRSGMCSALALCGPGKSPPHIAGIGASSTLGKSKAARPPATPRLATPW